MLGVSSRPIIKRLALNLAAQLRRLRAFPKAGVAMLLRSAAPPALSRQAIRLANHEHCKLGLATLLRLVIDIGKYLAQGSHLRTREVMSKQAQDFCIADRQTGLSGRNQDGPHLSRVRQQSRFAHRGCWLKSTGVSSKTS